MQPHYSIDDLQYLMIRLRDPDTGCPWDCKQTFTSILTYTLEEVYEVIDAVETADYQQLCDELGDLLFQVIFLSQLAEEQDHFDFDQVVSDVTVKLLRRHPHVFPDGTLLSRRSEGLAIDEDTIAETWEALKKVERATRSVDRTLDDIPPALPAMQRALKLQKRASTVGFDWPSPVAVLPVVSEEIVELKEAIDNADEAAIEDEFGDLLFTCLNLSRHLGIDPERALRGANAKFANRFEGMEELAAGRSLVDLKESDWQSLWQAVKNAEKTLDNKA